MVVHRTQYASSSLDLWLIANGLAGGLGYVQVKDPSLYDNLPRPIHDYVNHTVFTTSMTHQLHCLFMMGRVYAGVVHNDTSSLPADYHAHFLHCIDYIRQGVMCA